LFLKITKFLMSYNKEYNILYNHLYYNQIFNPINYFIFWEDISIEHCENLGIGLNYLYSRKQAWFVRKWHAKFYDYPHFMDKIIITTNPYSLYNFFGYRKYDVLKNGKIIAEADSEWIFVDTTSNKLEKIPDLFIEKFKSKVEKINFFNISIPATYSYQKSYTILHSDIDTNKHLNNISYLKYFYDSFSDEFINNFYLCEIKVIYKNQADTNEELIVKIYTGNKDKSYYNIKAGLYSQETLCCIIESVWKEYKK